MNRFATDSTIGIAAVPLQRVLHAQPWFRSAVSGNTTLFQSLQALRQHEREEAEDGKEASELEPVIVRMSEMYLPVNNFAGETNASRYLEAGTLRVAITLEDFGTIATDASGFKRFVEQESHHQHSITAGGGASHGIARPYGVHMPTTMLQLPADMNLQRLMDKGIDVESGEAGGQPASLMPSPGLDLPRPQEPSDSPPRSGALQPSARLAPYLHGSADPHHHPMEAGGVAEWYPGAEAGGQGNDRPNRQQDRQHDRDTLGGDPDELRQSVHGAHDAGWEEAMDFHDGIAPTSDEDLVITEYIHVLPNRVKAAMQAKIARHISAAVSAERQLLAQWRGAQEAEFNRELRRLEEERLDMLEAKWTAREEEREAEVVQTQRRYVACTSVSSPC